MVNTIEADKFLWHLTLTFDLESYVYVFKSDSNFWMLWRINFIIVYESSSSEYLDQAQVTKSWV